MSKGLQFVQLKRWYNTLICIVVFVGAALLILSIGQKDQIRFCSIEDDLYKELNLNAQDWMFYFFQSPQAAMTTHLDFSTRDGQRLTAIKLEAPNQVFVVTEYDYPHTHLGRKGYIISPDGIPTRWSEYSFTQLSQDIYCYEQK